MIRPSINTFILLFALISLPTSAASNPTTHEFSLDNGLKVIVREDHRTPILVSQLWYKDGPSYEIPASTGLAHALEHMMFKCSSNLALVETSRI